MSEETLGRVDSESPPAKTLSRAQSQSSKRKSQGGENDAGLLRRLSRTLSGALASGGYTNNDDDRYSDMQQESRAESWHMMDQVRALKEQADRDQNKARKLGITWKNLTVKGVGADAAFN